MFTRRKVLLALIRMHGTISKFRIVNLMFLISQDDVFDDPPYEFVPYKYGPFSFQLYSDLSHLAEKGYVVEESNLVTTIREKKAVQLDEKYETVTLEYFNNFRNLSDKILLKHTCSTFPEYTIFEKVIQPEYASEPGIVTVGYEGLSIDRFLVKMISHRISVVVDVRRNASSRKYGFSGNLKRFLDKFRIEYVHFPELGIDSGSRKNLDSLDDYQNLFSEYERTLESLPNLEIIKRIFNMGLSKKIALMCFESNPDYCHRHTIGKKLRRMGAMVIDL